MSDRKDFFIKLAAFILFIAAVFYVLRNNDPDYQEPPFEEIEFNKPVKVNVGDFNYEDVNTQYSMVFGVINDSMVTLYNIDTIYNIDNNYIYCGQDEKKGAIKLNKNSIAGIIYISKTKEISNENQTSNASFNQAY